MCRRHPLRPALRRNVAIATSVLAFPFPRIALIVRERSWVGFLNLGSGVISRTDCRGWHA